MDGVSAAASILGVLECTAKFIRYLKDAKNAPRDCIQFQAEAIDLKNLLNDLLQSFNQKEEDDVWHEAVCNLVIEHGPIDQYGRALQQYLAKIEMKDGLQKFKKQLLWTLSKEDVSNIQARIERLKSLVIAALSLDHL